jgi:hypothetical protein
VRRNPFASEFHAVVNDLANAKRACNGMVVSLMESHRSGLDITGDLKSIRRCMQRVRATLSSSRELVEDFCQKLSDKRLDGETCEVVDMLRGLHVSDSVSFAKDEHDTPSCK